MREAAFDVAGAEGEGCCFGRGARGEGRVFLCRHRRWRWRWCGGWIRGAAEVLVDFAVLVPFFDRFEVGEDVALLDEAGEFLAGGAARPDAAGFVVGGDVDCVEGDAAGLEDCG